MATHERLLATILPLLLLAFVSRDDGARELVVTDTAELVAALRSARPGDRIGIAPGHYSAVFASEIAGSADRPIVVCGSDEADPPVFDAGIRLSDVRYLTLRALVVAGAPENGINIDDGGSYETPSRFVTLERIVVKDVGGRANADGIKLSGVDDVTISECTIERWGRRGSGIDMVGCHRVSIERSTLRDDEHDPASSGIQAKGGSSQIVVRRCTFRHAGQRAINLGGSTGRPYFRPPTPGYEAKDLLVEGNVFVGSLAPLACVGCVDAVMRFNTILSPGKWVLRILQESRGDEFAPCRDGKFVDNLVVYDGRRCEDIVNVGPGTAPETFEFARNYWYRSDDPDRSLPSLPTEEVESKGGEDPRLVDAENGRLAEGSPAAAAGASALR